MHIYLHARRAQLPLVNFSELSIHHHTNMKKIPILPGTVVKNESDETVFGPGIQVEIGQSPYYTKAGILIEKSKRGNEVIYVETNSKRYVPANKDLVIGTITGKAGEYYRVLLQDKSVPVRLNQLAFENASKKNKPNLANGAAVYGRIILADPDLEAEMECVDGTTGKGEGFGELRDGYIFTVGLGFARSLLSNATPVLSLIGDRFTYDVAIGMNGKVWINSSDDIATLKIANCIQQAETVSPKQIQSLVDAL